MTTRREFLQTGLAGGLLLNLAGCSRPAGNDGQAQVLTAVIPVMLAGALSTVPKEAAEQTRRTVAGVETAIGGLSPAMQQEIGQLFDLLAFPLTRLLAAGLWSPWETARPEAIAGFLEGWRQSRFDLLKSGYAGLHDLILGAWYAQPESWAAIGYPGPPEVK